MRRLTAVRWLHHSDALSVQFIRYAVVGAIAAAADLAVFYVVNGVYGRHYLIAQTAAFMVGLAVNYTLSVAWVFRSSGRVPREALLFTAIGVGGLLLSYLLLWLLIDVLSVRLLRNLVAKAITACIVLAWNFFMRRRFAFARPPADLGPAMSEPASPASISQS